MSNSQSLDELISGKAAEFAELVRNAATLADNEEEIKMEVEKQLAFIQKEAGIKLDARYEFTVAQGLADSVYSRVIIEYKNPKSPSDRVGPKADSTGTKKVVDVRHLQFRAAERQQGRLAWHEEGHRYLLWRDTDLFFCILPSGRCCRVRPEAPDKGMMRNDRLGSEFWHDESEGTGTNQCRGC